MWGGAAGIVGNAAHLGELPAGVHLADEAERGYDPDTLRRRGGRPLLGSAPATVVPVRLDPELRTALRDRAQREDSSASEIIRQALRAWLHVA